jgi:hypothetical protein
LVKITIRDIPFTITTTTLTASIYTETEPPAVTAEIGILGKRKHEGIY